MYETVVYVHVNTYKGEILSSKILFIWLKSLTKGVCTRCCFADQTKARGAGTRASWSSRGKSLTVGWGRSARLRQWRLGLIHLYRGHAFIKTNKTHDKGINVQTREKQTEASLLTCAGSFAFPGVGLRGFGVEGASPAFEEPGMSFLRLGARSNPFPRGE